MIRVGQESVEILALDLGGVLLTDGTKTGFDLMSRDRNVDPLSLEALWQEQLRIPAEIGDLSSKALFERLSLETGLSETSVSEILLGEFRPLPEGVAVLREAKARGRRVLLATNHLTEWLPVWARRYEWFSLLDEIVCSSTIRVRKPDRAFFDVLKHTAGVSSAFPFVDDDRANVEAATDSGLDGRLAEGAWASELLDSWTKS